MLKRSYIPVLAITCCFSASAIHASAKHKNKISHEHKQIRKSTIGFQTGKEITFNTPFKGVITNTVKGIYYRTPLNNHLKVESAINYSLTQNVTTINKLGNKQTLSAYKISIPVTLQYYLLPEINKVRPYVGTGFQYNIGLNNTPSITNTENIKAGNIISNGTKYINIVFTQGVTFEVNTRIQINESLHFIPDNTARVIGIDLGIGYSIP